MKMSVEVYCEVHLVINAGKTAAIGNRSHQGKKSDFSHTFSKRSTKIKLQRMRVYFLPQRWRTTIDIDNRVLVLFAFFQSLIIVR